MGCEYDVFVLVCVMICSFLVVGLLDVIVINILGCGMMIKDYGKIFVGDLMQFEVVKVVGFVCDVIEFLEVYGLFEGIVLDLCVVYYLVCLLQYGQ